MCTSILESQFTRITWILPRALASPRPRRVRKNRHGHAKGVHGSLPKSPVATERDVRVKQRFIQYVVRLGYIQRTKGDCKPATHSTHSGTVSLGMEYHHSSRIFLDVKLPIPLRKIPSRVLVRLGRGQPLYSKNYLSDVFVADPLICVCFSKQRYYFVTNDRSALIEMYDRGCCRSWLYPRYI